MLCCSIRSTLRVAGELKSSAATRERGKFREQMLDTLEHWGVRDFRRLALLPEHALASRLGEAGARLQRLSRGEGMRTLALCEPLTHFEEAMELESAVETIESLSFVLNRLLDQLCTRLKARALAVQKLKLRLQLERRVADEQTTTVQELAGAGNSSISPDQGDGNLYVRTLRLPVAMHDHKVFLKLLQLDLAAYPPGAPVSKVWIAAEPARPRSAQRDLFLPVTPEAEKLEITLARITGVVGERRAGIAKLLDTHRPNAFRIERFVSQQETGSGSVGPTMSDTADVPPLALRILRPHAAGQGATGGGASLQVRDVHAKWRARGVARKDPVVGRTVALFWRLVGRANLIVNKWRRRTDMEP